MTDVTMDPTRVTLGPGIFSYANLLRPVAVDANSKPKYSMSFVFPKSDVKTLAAIQQAMNAAIEKGMKEKWGGVLPPNLKKPLRDGAEREAKEEIYKDSFFINANCFDQPKVYLNDAARTLIIDEAQVYSGMEGYIYVSFYPYGDKTSMSKGIAVWLNMCLKTGDGKRLGGTNVDVSEAFAGIPAPQTGAPVVGGVDVSKLL